MDIEKNSLGKMQQAAHSSLNLLEGSGPFRTKKKLKSLQPAVHSHCLLEGPVWDL